MKFLLTMVLLLAMGSTACAAINLAVSQQAGKDAQERAGQLAGQLSGALGTPVKVVALADTAEIEAWLNRFATADLALVEAGYAASRPGQFVMIGPVGRELVLIGRQGIGGDLPQKAAGALGGKMERSAAPAGPVPPPANAVPPIAPSSVRQSVEDPAGTYNSSKSASEDRYFVIQIYREKFGRDPESERLDYWTQQLQSGVLSKLQFSEQVCRQGLALCEKTK